MALPKLFERIFWHNNTTPDINEDNLNSMSKAIDEIDDRVIELGDTIMEDVPQIIEALDDLDEVIDTVQGYTTTAEDAATTATNKAGEASASATTASDKAGEAAASATTASNKAGEASASATTASNKADAASASATSAANQALKAEGYAVGEQNGSAVSSGSPYYHNNAEYYSDQALVSASAAAASATEAASWSAHPPYIGVNGNWYVWDTSDSQYEDSGIDASITITVGTIQMLAYGSTPEVTNSGTSTDAVFNFKLPISAGVKSVAKTGTSGLVDSYRMTFDDNSYFDYTVTNGQDGINGDDGYSPEVTITTIAGGHRVTITDADHPNGQSFDVLDGTGSGDMQASVYDPNGDVATAGGIPSYVSGKADKVTGATNGNFAGLDSNGNLTDSGKKASDFLTSHQDISGKMATDGSNAAETVSLNRLQNGYIGTNGTGKITASQHGAHAEGYAESGTSLTTRGYIQATGYGAHAEGYATGGGNIMASGNGAHAEGYNSGETTTASGVGAHAEGSGTTASGNYSHAEGKFNVAGYEAQHVSGKYNSNKSTTLFEVGNGTSTSARSNAFEVYSDGSISMDDGASKIKVVIATNTSVTLSTSNDTTVTFNNAAITADSAIDVYTSDPVLTYKTMSISSGSCTVTFDKQDSASTISVKIYIK